MAYSFEELRTSIEQLPSTSEEDARQLFWVVPSTLGVAADARGGREVFLVGGVLSTRSHVVGRHLQHGLWRGAQDEPFEASRLVLPPAPYFVALSALIASEMVRLGLGSEDRTVQAIFSDVEPLIELSLKRALLSEEAIRGLLGELVLLDYLLASITDHPEFRSSVLDMWRGHQHASRDFTVGTTAVEVKTTSFRSSIHHINSLSQIEPDSDDQRNEITLYLMSIGLAAAPHGSLSVPRLVERIRLRLRDGESESPLELRFLRDVRHYAASDGSGYDHLTMSNVPAYAARYSTTFEPRLFDTCDTAFRVVRRSTLVDTFVRPEDISYTIALPDDSINEHNPVRDWRSFVSELVRGALAI